MNDTTTLQTDQRFSSSTPNEFKNYTPKGTQFLRSVAIGDAFIKYVVFRTWDAKAQMEVDTRVHWTKVFQWADSQDALPRVSSVIWFKGHFTGGESYASGRFNTTSPKGPRLAKILVGASEALVLSRDLNREGA